MQFGGGRRHHLEVGEQPSGAEPARRLRRTGSASGHRRDDGWRSPDTITSNAPSGSIESARSQSITVTRWSPAKLPAGPRQHGRRIVDGHHPGEGGSGLEGQSGQSPVPASEVEEGAGAGRQQGPEYVLAGGAGGEPVDTVEVPVHPVSSLQLDVRGRARGAAAASTPPSCPRPSADRSLVCQPMELRLDGRTALVTGGSRGSGRPSRSPSPRPGPR